MKQVDRLNLTPASRILLIVFSVAGLSVVYLYQRTEVLSWLMHAQPSANSTFIFNRSLRLLVNDVFMLLLLAGWFSDRSVLKLAVMVQAVDFFILLPLYLAIKLTWEGDSEISTPLLSQFHRLIVNPTLMILLIPAVYFQRLTNAK